MILFINSITSYKSFYLFVSYRYFSHISLYSYKLPLDEKSLSRQTIRDLSKPYISNRDNIFLSF